MSPILVRPVREQLQHDRIIRLLETKHRRRYEVGINPGAERNVSMRTRGEGVYPDLVLQSQDKGHRSLAAIEVETGESVNHLEALAEWVPFSSLRTDFILYVPSFMVDVARRLCLDMGVRVSEIWSYHMVGDEVRFTLVDRVKEVVAPARASARPRARTARPKLARSKGPKRKRAAAKASGRQKAVSSRAKPRKSSSAKVAARRSKAAKVTKRATASKKKRAQKRR